MKFPTNMLNDPAQAQDGAHFLNLAHLESNELGGFPRLGIEYNEPANLIILSDCYESAGKVWRTEDVRRAGEKLMLLFALHARGIDPGSVWLSAAFAVGWRFEKDSFSRE